MSIWMQAALVAMVLCLCGCATSGGGVEAAQRQSLQSLPLFGSHGEERFVLYVSCTSEKVNCVNVQNAFGRWAREHDVPMHQVEANDAAFQSGPMASANDASLPYRVAIDYRPAMSAGYAAKSFDRSGDSYPPTVSYSSTVSVFDSTTGNLLQQLFPHAQQEAGHGKQANPYLNSQLRRLLASLFPAAPDR